MSFNIEVEGGSSVRLPTAGKYCDRDIVITAIGGGGEDNAIELAFETTFNIAETIRSGNAITVLTIDTGFNTYVKGDAYILIVECINDIETDMSVNHFKGRISFVSDQDGGYMGVGGGYAVRRYPDGTYKLTYPNDYGLYIGGVGHSVKNITFKYRENAGYGILASGDYRVRLYKLNQSFFGIGGLCNG